MDVNVYAVNKHLTLSDILRNHFEFWVNFGLFFNKMYTKWRI